MKVKQETYDVGVIVGRFQVHDFHQGHIDLIDTVCDKHDKVIIFLGLSGTGQSTRENPLDFESRKQMILEAFPRVNVLYIKDMPDDEAWSKVLDGQISDVVTASQSVVLYGSRDSFIRRYHGKYPTLQLESDSYQSGTEVRKGISRKSVKASPDFRAGVVWAAFDRFPTTYPTVDIAIFNEDHSKILLGRKPHSKQFQLIGGFSDPESESYEQDARREVHEEAGIEITDPVYIGSFKIDDWRYRSEIDKIKTALFVATHQFGSPKAGDDIAEVRWFDTVQLRMNDIAPNHRILVSAALDHVCGVERVSDFKLNSLTLK